MDDFKDNEPAGTRPDYVIAREKLDVLLTEHKITVVVRHVPTDVTKPRKDWQVHWSCDLLKNGRKIMTTDFTQGVGHVEGYKHATYSSTDMVMTLQDLLVKGKQTTFDRMRTAGHGLIKMSLKPPTACDLMPCLTLDGEAINHPTYESWASEYGYDLDSRKCEAMYQACLKTGLTLRAALGDELLGKISELSRSL